MIFCLFLLHAIEFLQPNLFPAGSRIMVACNNDDSNNTCSVAVEAVEISDFESKLFVLAISNH